MTPWTITVTGARHVRTVIGTADTAHEATRDMAIATRSLMEHGGDSRSHYELSVGPELVAIIGIGDDEHGRVDHAGAAAMLTHLHHVDELFGQP